MTSVAPEQLALIAPELPKLTDRQQTVLEALQRAGQDGLDTDAAGALLCAAKGIHGPNDRCQYDGRSGKQVLEALAAKGHARYRRANRARGIHGAWLATGQPDPEPPRPNAMLADDQPIPF